MGPFNMPWLTFLAFVVIDVSFVVAVVWALLDIRRDREAGPGAPGEESHPAQKTPTHGHLR